MKGPSTTAYLSLRDINGIRFTPREVDIIAFILGGRTTKKIASFLSTAPKTVDNHIQNIMTKIECHSREGIIEFIEKSEKFLLIRKHYLNLLITYSFEKTLTKLATTLAEETLLCLVVACRKDEIQQWVIELFVKYLQLVGIKVSIKSINQYAAALRNKSLRSTHTFFMVSHEKLMYFLTEEEQQKDEEVSIILRVCSRMRQHSYLNSYAFLLLNREPSQQVPLLISRAGYVDLREQENYYFSVLDLLKRISPSSNFDTIVSGFVREWSLIYDSPDKTINQISSKALKEMQPHSFYQIAIRFLQRFWRKEKTRGNLAFCVFFGCGLTVFLLVLIERVNYTAANKIMTHLTRSDLIIPADSSLLTRPVLLSQIEESFKGTHPLKTVALVGIAGAGKTTLARQYARLQKSPVIWEINAETKEALVDSFENLAQALSTTAEHQRMLRELQEIKDSKKREKRILQFVKERLTLHKDWILIYDNVETFLDFQNQLPQDNGTWGQGKVIVTTRDSNIQNMGTIAEVIQIKELDSDEKLTLFMKILNHGVNHSWTPVQREEANTFLKAIPPYPLDICIAAYYIKSTHVSYERYLKRLTEYRKDFIDVQENILKSANNYPKVRYSIITLSLNQLMELHKDFAYLLLFISFVDSQNIPRDLLETRMDDVTVDNFIFNLKKYSLITSHSSTAYPWRATFSIHRSTQEISLAHLRERLNLKSNDQLVQRVAQNLKSYVNQLMEKEDLSQLRLLTNHCEMFLSHPQLLTEELKGSLFCDLGGMHLSLGNYAKAKKFLKDALLKLNEASDNRKSQNYEKKARVLAYLGNVYGDLGSYEKAKDFLEQSLLIYKENLPTSHGGAAWALTYLGNVCRDLGDPEKAKDLLEQSLHLYTTYLPEDHAGNARASAYLGIVSIILGDYEKAKNLLEQSLYIYKTHLSKNHVGIAWVSAHLGNAYGELGNYEKARNLLERSIVLYKEHFPEDHIKVGWALSYLGDVYRVTGEYEKAKKALEQSMVIYKKHLPENHIVIAGILVYLSDVHKDLSEYEKAKELLQQSLSIYQKHFPANHPETAWALAHLGDIYRIKGNFKKAESLLGKSLAIYRQHFSEDHNEIVWTLERLRYTHDKISDYKKDLAAIKP